MINNTFTLFLRDCAASSTRTPAPLFCVWIETGNPAQPLSCRWISTTRDNLAADPDERPDAHPLCA